MYDRFAKNRLIVLFLYSEAEAMFVECEISVSHSSDEETGSLASLALEICE